MGGKLIAGALGAAALLVIAFVVIAGGGTVATAQAPKGGCATHAVSGPATQGEQKSPTLNANQMAAARTIVAVGKGMAIDEWGIAIALGTAMQESSLDPNSRSGRSVGLFQQQGELYAGFERTDPAQAARAFYEQLVARVPNYAEPAAGTFASIAQTVQASGAGAAKYAPWEGWATALAKELYAGTAAINPGSSHKPVGSKFSCRLGGGSGPIQISVHGLFIDAPRQSGLSGTWEFPTERAVTAAAAALSYLGTTYAWGGGNATGPTKGISDNGGPADRAGDFNKIGFDCSGLMEYAWAQASVTLPGVARAQQNAGIHSTWATAKPGDLLFWGRPAHHVAMYLGKLDGRGDDYMVEAPQSGDVVKVSKVRTGGDFQSLVVRPYPGS